MLRDRFGRRELSLESADELQMAMRRIRKLSGEGPHDAAIAGEVASHPDVVGAAATLAAAEAPARRGLQATNADTVTLPMVVLRAAAVVLAEVREAVDTGEAIGYGTGGRAKAVEHAVRLTIASPGSTPESRALQQVGLRNSLRDCRRTVDNDRRAAQSGPSPGSRMSRAGLHVKERRLSR